MPYSMSGRMIGPIVYERGCPCCGGGGRIGADNRICSVCKGTGKGARE